MKSVKKNKNSLFNALLVIGLLFFSSFYIDIWHTPNPVSRALPVLTLHENSNLEITPYEKVGLDKAKVGDKYYSDKAPLPSLITYPFYEFASAIGFEKWNYKNPQYKSAPKWYVSLSMIIFIGTFICSVIPFILMIWFAFRTTEIYRHKPILIILGFFGTFLFIYSGTYFNHIISGFFLAIATYFIRFEKHILLSGLFCGLAFLSEYTLGLFAAVLPLLLIKKEIPWKGFLRFGLGLLPAILIYAWYNYTLTGNPFTFIFYYTDFETFSQGIKQNYGFGLPSAESILGLLISPYMGILWFFPPLIFFVLYWRKIKVRNLIKSPVFVNSWVLFLLISCYFIWWGGYSWGPRYLIPMACILAFHAGEMWKELKPKIRTAGLGVLAVSFLLQWADKATVLFLIPDRLSNQGEASLPFNEIVLPALKDGRFNENNLFSWALDLDPKMSAILFGLLFILWVSSLEILNNKALQNQ